MDFFFTNRQYFPFFTKNAWVTDFGFGRGSNSQAMYALLSRAPRMVTFTLQFLAWKCSHFWWFSRNSENVDDFKWIFWSNRERYWYKSKCVGKLRPWTFTRTRIRIHTMHPLPSKAWTIGHTHPLLFCFELIFATKFLSAHMAHNTYFSKQLQHQKAGWRSAGVASNVAIIPKNFCRPSIC